MKTRMTWLVALALGMEICCVALARRPSLGWTAAAALVYLIAAVWVWRHGGRFGRVELRLILLAALVFRLTLVFTSAPPDSAFQRVAWDGRIQAMGFNPYQYPPASDLFAPIRSATSAVPLAEVAAFHPPLAELVFRWNYERMGGGRALKIVYFACDLLLLLLLLRILRQRGRPPAWLLLYGWAPLAVVEISGHGHIEAMAGVVVLATLHWAGRKPGRAAAALATAAMLQWYAAALIPAVAATRGQRWRPTLAWLVIWPSVLALPFLWMNKHFALAAIAGNVIAYVRAQGTANASIFALMAAWFGSRAAALEAVGVVAAAMALTSGRRLHPQRAAVVVLAALLLVMPHVAAWNLLWLLPLAAIYPEPAWIWWAAAMPLVAALGTPGWVVWAEYVPVYGLLAWQGRGWRRNPQKEEEQWANA